MNKKPKSIILMILFFIPLISSFIMLGISEFPKTAPSKSEIKFMTYNIHFGQGMDDLLNLERIAQNILTEDPDIIGLQEVENGRITSQGVDMAFWLAKRLNMMDYFYYPAANEHAFGVALLSKFPIKSVCGTQIPAILQERVLIHGVIKINSTLDIDVFVTHLGIREENNSAQIDYILKHEAEGIIGEAFQAILDNKKIKAENILSRHKRADICLKNRNFKLDKLPFSDYKLF